MIALAIDILAAFLLARYLQSLWIQVPLAIFGGMASVFIGIIAAEIINGKENIDLVRYAFGVFFHPLITLAWLWYFRRKKRKDKGKAALT